MKTHDKLQEKQVLAASYARALVGVDKPTEKPDPYECQIDGFDVDERVSFSEPYTFTQCGTTYNYQTVIVDGGKEVATLEEIQPWPIFEEMRVRYIVPLSEDEAKKLRKHPNFRLGYYENPELSFKTLQDLINYLITYKIIEK